MRNLLMVLWFVTVIIGGLIGYLNREVLECNRRAYVRHGVTFYTTECVVVNK